MPAEARYEFKKLDYRSKFKKPRRKVNFLNSFQHIMNQIIATRYYCLGDRKEVKQKPGCLQIQQRLACLS